MTMSNQIASPDIIPSAAAAELACDDQPTNLDEDHPLSLQDDQSRQTEIESINPADASTVETDRDTRYRNKISAEIAKEEAMDNKEMLSETNGEHIVKREPVTSINTPSSNPSNSVEANIAHDRRPHDDRLEKSIDAKDGVATKTEKFAPDSKVIVVGDPDDTKKRDAPTEPNSDSYDDNDNDVLHIAEAGRGGPGAALPAAYAVDDDAIIPGVPLAEKVTDSGVGSVGTLKKNKEETKRKRKCCKIIAVLVFLAAIIVIVVGATTGFGSKQQSESAKGAEKEKEKDSSDSSDDEEEVLVCPPLPPNRTYLPPSDRERYCKDGKCWEHVGPTLTGPVNEKFGAGISFDSSGMRFVLRYQHGNGCNGFETGVVRVYDITEDYDVVQVGQTFEGLDKGDYAKGLLSGDGKRLVVGYPKSDGEFGDLNNAGAFRVFELNEHSGNWTALGDAMHGTEKKSRFGDGLSFSEDGTILAVSAPHHSDRMGRVYVYKYREPILAGDTMYWEQIGQTLIPDENLTIPMYGNKIRLTPDGSALVVGSKNEDEIERGEIDLFRYDETLDLWVAAGNPILGISDGDSFGRNIDTSRTGLILAGGGGSDHIQSANATTGFIRVFERDTGNETWKQLGGPIMGEIPGTQLGQVSLSSDGLRLATGPSRAITGGIGLARTYFIVFDYIDGEWAQVGGKIEGMQSDDYGNSIKISPDGTTLLTNRPEGEYAAVRLYKLIDDPSESIVLSQNK